MERRRFTDRVAIVTGGGSGLGRALCYAFAEESASVVCSDINIDTAKETVSGILNSGGKAAAVKADVTIANDVENIAKAAIEEYGKIDILVNNAGINVRQGLLDTEEETWDKMTAVDLKGPFLVAKVVLPYMIERNYGKIVNVASVAGVVGCVSSAYTASKAGLIGMTRVWALEFAPYRICVNSVAPGFFATPINEALRKSPLGEKLAKQVPLGFGKVEQIVPVVLFLSSSESDYITGHCLVVDGGLSGTRDFGPEYWGFDKGKK